MPAPPARTDHLEPSHRAVPVVQIGPHRGGRLVGWRELWAYRDMLYYLTWRDIKARYAQSVLGIGWAVIQPLFTMIVFTVVFGHLARIRSDGLPYAIFSYAALVPWLLFSSALHSAATSLLKGAALIDKIYFPRLILPLSGVLGRLVDFLIAFVVLILLMIYFQQTPTLWTLFLPVVVLILLMTALGLGLWLAGLALQYRDVAYGLGFGVTVLMYLSPVVYPTSLVPARFRLIYALNPMSGVIEAFRAALLGHLAMPWDLLAVGSTVAMFLLLTGLLWFTRTERFFADVV